MTVDHTRRDLLCIVLFAVAFVGGSWAADIGVMAPAIIVPIVSGVTAGRNIPDDMADWEISGFRQVSGFGGGDGGGGRFVLVPVEGDSLTSQRIYDGDLLLVRITRDYVPGQIGIWQTPSGRTAKFAFYDPDGYIVLHNDNGWRQTWSAGEIRLLGVAVRVERDLL